MSRNIVELEINGTGETKRIIVYLEIVRNTEIKRNIRTKEVEDYLTEIASTLFDSQSPSWMSK